MTCATAGNAESLPGSELSPETARLALILERNADGVIVVDGAGSVTYANGAAERILGLTRLDDGGWRGSGWQWPAGTRIDDGGIAGDMFADVLSSGRSLQAAEYVITRADGRPTVISVNAAPLDGGPGNDGAVASIRDITSSRRAMLAGKLLAQCSTALCSSLESGVILQRVLDLLVPDYADHAAFLRVEDDELKPSIAVFRAPVPDALPGAPCGGGTSIDPARIMTVLSAGRAAAFPVAGTGTGHAAVAPVQVRGVTLGALLVEWTTADRPNDVLDLPLLEELAQGAGAAMDHARRDGPRDELTPEIARLNVTLQQRVTELETLLRVIPIGIEIAEDPVAARIRPNPALADLLGMSAAEEFSPSGPAAGELPFRIYANGRQVPAGALPVHVAAREGRLVDRAEYQLVRGDASQRTVLAHAAPLYDDSGGVRGSVGAWIDITDLKRAEAELRERVKELRCLFDISRSLFDEGIDSDVDLRHSLTRVLELLPSGFQYPEQTVAAVELGGITYSTSGRQPESTLSMSVPIPEGGASLGTLSVMLIGSPPEHFTDVFLPEERMLLEAVAERISAAVRLRAARTNLLQREAQFRSLIENSSDVITLLDAAGRITYQSPRLTAILGHTVEELVGSTAVDLVHEEDLEAVRAQFRRALERPDATTVVQYRMRRSDGAFEWVESLGHNMIHDPAVGSMVVNTRIITERLAAQEQIRFQAGLLDAVGQAVIAADRDAAIVYWNRAAERLYGWTRAEALGQPLSMLVPPAAKAAAGAILRGIMEGQPWTGELEVQRKDGTLVSVLETDAPFFDADGRIAGIIGASNDLTELKRLETQRLHAQKMEAVGRLAGGVAHDFNNMLTAIVGHADLILMDVPHDSAPAGDAREIVRTVDRAASLTRQLLAFSRCQVLQPRTISLATVASEMQPMLRRLIGADIELCVELKAAAFVRADPVQVEQVILNLIVNSRDAMPAGGCVTLTVDEVRLAPPAAAAAGGLVAGAYAVLSVIDNGAGVRPEALEHVFEPFYTTKSQGTGLGLATVYGIIKQSDGDVIVSSMPGEGTRFDVYVPSVMAVAEPVAARGRGRGLGGSETVLIVQDEDAVRSLACRVLRRKGYNVLEAAGPAEALDRFGDCDEDFDMILSDVVMPGMSGPEFVSRLLTGRPACPTLYVSGYMAEEVQRRNALADDAWFLQKPFTPDELALKVRAVLDAWRRPAEPREVPP